MRLIWRNICWETWIFTNSNNWIPLKLFWSNFVSFAKRIFGRLFSQSSSKVFRLISYWEISLGPDFEKLGPWFGLSFRIKLEIELKRTKSVGSLAIFLKKQTRDLIHSIDLLLELFHQAWKNDKRPVSDGGPKLWPLSGPRETSFPKQWWELGSPQNGF